MASACYNKQCMYNPALAKSLALRTAMHLCFDLGFSRVDFEGECKEVVLVAASSVDCASELYLIIYDIQSLMRTQPNWIVQYAPRETNHVQHIILPAYLVLCRGI